VHRQPWPTRGEVRTATFEYIGGWYNRRRRHSTLDYLSPLEFEEQSARGKPGLIAPAGAAA
jgi:transposase InsO family protein